MARKSASPRRLRAVVNTALNASSQTAQQAVEQEQPPKKRGRPRKSLDTSAADSASVTQPAPKKKGRPSLKDKATEAQPSKQKRPQAQSSQAGTSTGTAKVGRKRKSTGTPNDDNDPGEDAQQPPAKRRKGKSSLGGETTTTVEVPAPKRRSTAARASLDSQASQRRRLSSVDEEPQEETPGRRQSSGRRRSSQPYVADFDAPPKSYAHVAPKTRTIHQSTIDEKWNPLSASSIAAATETLTLSHRPVMQRIAGTQQRRAHTASALSLLHRRITRKLQRGMPFPPATAPAVAGKKTIRGRRGGRGAIKTGGHEAELDFESVIDGARSLERQLEPTLHAVELLQEEKARMEKELELDYKTLRNLEAGARTQAREQKEKLKKAHALVPESSLPKIKREGQDVEMVFETKDSAIPSGTLFSDIEDGELRELAMQLSGHMDSIKANLLQADGLLPALASSRAALRNVLVRHLDEEQYDSVVLG